MKTNEEFYGPHLVHMKTAECEAKLIAKVCLRLSGIHDAKIVSRIKSPESMEKKVLGDGLPVNYESVLEKESDAVGVRIITNSLSDVYKVFKSLNEFAEKKDYFRVIHIKDYIKNPKASGYRSLHIILGIRSEDKDFPELKAELQIRTAAMDCFASLEHLAQYKQVIDLTPEIEDILETYRLAAETEVSKLSQVC